MWSLYRQGRREEAQQLLLPSSWCRWKAEAIKANKGKYFQSYLHAEQMLLLLLLAFLKAVGKKRAEMLVVPAMVVRGFRGLRVGIGGGSGGRGLFRRVLQGRNRTRLRSRGKSEFRAAGT